MSKNNETFSANTYTLAESKVNRKGRTAQVLKVSPDAILSRWALFAGVVAKLFTNAQPGDTFAQYRLGNGQAEWIGDGTPGCIEEKHAKALATVAGINATLRKSHPEASKAVEVRALKVQMPTGFGYIVVASRKRQRGTRQHFTASVWQGGEA